MSTSLSAELKAKLRDNTRRAAQAFVEDMEWIREVVERLETSRGELRRLSAVLRRLLVEGDIQNIAAPRMGRITILAPDNNPFYVAERHLRYAFFASGGVKIFGQYTRALWMANSGKPKPNQTLDEHGAAALGFLKDVKITALVALRADNFLSQRVLCYFSQWLTRRAAIKYVAHVASGVHSGEATDTDEKLAERISAACVFAVKDGQMRVHVLPELGTNSADFRLTPREGAPNVFNFESDALDPILVEMLAAARFLAESPDVATLEKIIRNGG